MPLFSVKEVSTILMEVSIMFHNLHVLYSCSVRQISIVAVLMFPSLYADYCVTAQ